MSQANIDHELQNSEFRTPSTTPVIVINIGDATYGKAAILAYVGGEPNTYAVVSEGFTTQFALGCIIVDTTNGIIKTNSAATVPTWNTMS